MKFRLTGSNGEVFAFGKSEVFGNIPKVKFFEKSEVSSNGEVMGN